MCHVQLGQHANASNAWAFLLREAANILHIVCILCLLKVSQLAVVSVQWCRGTLNRPQFGGGALSLDDGGGRRLLVVTELAQPHTHVTRRTHLTRRLSELHVALQVSFGDRHAEAVDRLLNEMTADCNHIVKDIPSVSTQPSIRVSRPP